MGSGQAKAVATETAAGGVEVAEPPKGLMILSMIGPGIVWAGSAIGGGELVLIPRVGSVYGMMFLWMPLLAIAIKYFMLNEIGRWSIVTGTSIFDGLAMIPGPRKWLSWILLFVSLYLGAVHIGGLVAMVGINFHTIVQVFTPFTWSIVIMVSFVALSWTNRYSLLERVLIVIVGLLTISAVLIGFAFFPPLKDLAEGFAFQIPSVTPDWAVTNYKISKTPMVEILPAMAFAGCGGAPTASGIFRLGPFQGIRHGLRFRWASEHGQKIRRLKQSPPADRSTHQGLATGHVPRLPLGSQFSHPARHVLLRDLGDHHPPPDQGSSRWNEIHHHPVADLYQDPRSLGPLALPGRSVRRDLQHHGDHL